MKNRGRVRWACFGPVIFLVLLCCFVFASGAEEISPDGSSQDPFLRAEYFFHAGKYLEARQSYDEYLRLFPAAPKTGLALFRLGQIEFDKKSFATALRYFNLVLKQEKEASLLHQALFYIGKNYFELGQYERANEVFQKLLKTDPDVNRRWETILFLGKLDEKKFDYSNAVHKLLHVYNKSVQEELRSHARQSIKKIIRENLSRESAEALASRYQTGFPVDLLLLRLQDIYRVNGNLEKYRASLQDFLRRFPEHSQAGEVEKSLSQIRTLGSRGYKLGAVLPLTGKHALTGQQVLQGIQLAWNQLGFKERETLKLEVRDSAKMESVKSVVEELARDPAVLGILGPLFSDHVKESIPLLEKYQLPLFTPTASSSGLPELSDYIFRNAMTRANQARFLAEYAVNQLQLRRFVVLYPDEPYGRQLKDSFAEEVEALGAEVAASVFYNRKQTDFKNQILEMGGMSDNQLLKASKDLVMKVQRPGRYKGDPPLSEPVIEQGFWEDDEVERLRVSLELNFDAVFIPGFYDKVALIIPQFIFYNIVDVAFLGANGWNSPELVKNAGKHLKNGYFVDGFFLNSERPEVREFVENYKKSFGEEPTILSAQSYDAARMILNLVRDGVKNRLQLKNRLFSVKEFSGASGGASILPSGDSEKNLFIMKVERRKIVQAN